MSSMPPARCTPLGNQFRGLQTMAKRRWTGTPAYTQALLGTITPASLPKVNIACTVALSCQLPGRFRSSYGNLGVLNFL